MIIVETTIVASLILIVTSVPTRLSAPVRYVLLVIALLKFAILPSDVDIPFEILLLYLAGALFVFVRLSVRLFRLRRLAAGAHPFESDLFRAACEDVGIRKNLPRLLVSDEPVGPMSFGVFRRVVLIPRRLINVLDDERLRVVFAHELVHHRRGDLIVSHLQSWLSIVWWFHPIFHLLSRNLERVREEACDDFLIARRLTTGDAYCSLLLDAASNVGAVAMARHPLDRRIRRIMDARVAPRDRVSMKGRIALLVIALVILPNLQNRGSWSDSPSPSPSPSPSDTPSPSPSPRP